MTDSNIWERDAEEYREAVAEDEYAELRLKTGDYLITDWEGDGVFNPYVIPDPENGLDGRDPESDDTQTAIAEAIGNALGVRVGPIEWSTSNGAWYPLMDRPDD